MKCWLLQEDLFRDGIAVQDRFFAVRSMNEELIGADNDGGRLTLTVQYYDSADETEAAERMKVLHQRYRERRQRNMKMPSINVVFKEKGISAIERSERGIVLMILKEETLPSVTEVNLYTADDIPKELSDSNREQLELALRGYVNSPKKVIAEIISSEAEDYTDILKVIENKRFDYLVIPDIGTSHIDTIATWVKGMRTNKDKMIKAVLPDCTADTEGVINFVNKTIRTKSKTYTTAQYCSRIAGIIAGTPMTISCTYAPLSEVIGCDVWTKEEMDTMAGAGSCSSSLTVKR